MEKTDVVIIGAGVVGLAIAERLSHTGRSIVVVEYNDSFGRETSSRNSEVIHAGFYYPPGSLKARLCVEGNRLLYDFCRKHGIPHRSLGKLLIARSRDEEEKVQKLFEQGIRNGLEGLALLDKQGIVALEPAVAGSAGMFSPFTGILDTHAFMKRLEQLAMTREVIFAYNCKAVAVTRVNGSYEIGVIDADGAPLALVCEMVINAAGLSADRIAGLAGIDLDAAEYRIRYCKGEYFGVASRHRGKLSHLVYPAPSPISLGIHCVVGLDGNLKLGPNAFFVESIDYSVDAAHGREFYLAGRTLCPFIEEHDLSPSMAGIRPKLQQIGETFRDFVIQDERDRGLPGFINLVGIESPGLTSSLAIANLVAMLAS
jgi:L-2-hydroxyglutarate oxidase LhgO